MMHQTFAPAANGSARLLLGSVSNDWERDRQEGFGFIMAGVQQGILNVDKHGHLHISSPEVALEMLAMFQLPGQNRGCVHSRHAHCGDRIARRRQARRVDLRDEDRGRPGDARVVERAHRGAEFLGEPIHRG